MSGTVFAVVVTYNPDDKLADRLQALREQVQGLLVVDNGSNNAEAVRSMALQAGCSVVLNLENLGIAEALNQGARAAIQLGSQWLATFDQDSQVAPEAIAQLLNASAALPQLDRVAILAMSHRDRGTGRDYHRAGEILKETEQWRSVRTSITSGSLVRISVFSQVGFFDTRLFIDTVDLEFCLRCRSQGLTVMENRVVILAHSMGNSTTRVVLGFPLVLTGHSPLRRYYITRNQLEMCRRFVGIDPRWALGAFWDLASGSAITLLLETERCAKLYAMLSGLGDFMLRRFGRRKRPL